jgi:hypothetical protein
MKIYGFYLNWWKKDHISVWSVEVIKETAKSYIVDRSTFLGSFGMNPWPRAVNKSRTEICLTLEELGRRIKEEYNKAVEEHKNALRKLKTDYDQIFEAIDKAMKERKTKNVSGSGQAKNS